MIFVIIVLAFPVIINKRTASLFEYFMVTKYMIHLLQNYNYIAVPVEYIHIQTHTYIYK